MSFINYSVSQLGCAKFHLERQLPEAKRNNDNISLIGRTKIIGVDKSSQYTQQAFCFSVC